MKKKLILFAFIFAFLLSCCCSASIIHETVEISFKVGDSKLLVNGEEMTVETPYVVGEGVTLVPVRVITEAFGAKVEWDGAERKVTLTTEEKKIELWIGKIDANINGEKLKLLSAPEISNNVTMVPLRFISEGFGAEVSYSNVTKQITINKMPDAAKQDDKYLYISDDRSLYAVLPDSLVMNDPESDSGTFVFGTGLRYDLTANTVIYSAKSNDKLEKSAENEKDKQTELVTSKNISVTDVEKTVMNGIDVYYYQLVENSILSGERVVATKAFFNHGQKSYMYLSFVADSEYVLSDAENLDVIKLEGFDVSVPTAYSGNVLDSSTARPVSTGIERVEFKVFKATGESDFKEYLKINQRVLAVHGPKTSYAENEIYTAEYTFMDKKVSAYEYFMDAAGVNTRGLIFGYDGYIIYAEFVSNFSDEEVKEVIENLCFDFEKLDAPVFENAKNLKDIGKASTTVSSEDISFNIPDSFEITYSSDNRLIIARDTESDLVLTCIVRADTIDNDDTEKGLRPSYNFGMVESKVKKKTVNALMSETENSFEALSWRSCAGPRRIFDSSDMAKTGTDFAKFSKTVSENCDFFINCFHVRTDDGLFEDSQRLHTFVFSYSEDCHNYSTMMKITSIMLSVNDK